MNSLFLNLREEQMFPQRQQEQQKTAKTEKQFMGIDKETNWIWWKEQISYLFISANQITEVKLIPATDSSINVYARIDLKDRFEYFLIDNRKTLAAAKKLAEDFTKTIESKSYQKIETSNIKEESVEDNLNGFEALKQLKKQLKG
jgi:hypothetical protein